MRTGAIASYIYCANHKWSIRAIDLPAETTTTNENTDLTRDQTYLKHCRFLKKSDNFCCRLKFHDINKVNKFVMFVKPTLADNFSVCWKKETHTAKVR